MSSQSGRFAYTSASTPETLVTLPLPVTRNATMPGTWKRPHPASKNWIICPGMRMRFSSSASTVRRRPASGFAKISMMYIGRPDHRRSRDPSTRCSPSARACMSLRSPLGRRNTRNGLREKPSAGSVVQRSATGKSPFMPSFSRVLISPAVLVTNGAGSSGVDAKRRNCLGMTTLLIGGLPRRRRIEGERHENGAPVVESVERAGGTMETECQRGRRAESEGVGDERDAARAGGRADEAAYGRVADNLERRHLLRDNALQARIVLRGDPRH